MIAVVNSRLFSNSSSNGTTDTISNGVTVKAKRNTISVCSNNNADALNFDIGKDIGIEFVKTNFVFSVGNISNIGQIITDTTEAEIIITQINMVLKCFAAPLNTAMMKVIVPV